MRIFLTGVTGFLGSHIAESLLRAGHEVAALARDPAAVDPDLSPWLAGSVPGRLILAQGSLGQEATLEEAVAGADAVVHVAGLIQARTERDYLRVNRDGTEAVLRSIERTRPPLRRFVLLSSQAAGGPAREGRAVTGEDPPRPVSAYGRSKLAGEERALARAREMPVTVLRPPVVFGARDRMLAGVFRSVGRGLAMVWGDGSNAFQAVHAPDVARAVSLCLEVEHPSGSIFYTSDEQVLDWNSFIAALADARGRRVRVVHAPPIAFAAAAFLSTALSFLTRRPPLLSVDKLRELREPAWLCSSRSARDCLGWSPSLSLDQALAATFSWYRSRGLA